MKALSCFILYWLCVLVVGTSVLAQPDSNKRPETPNPAARTKSIEDGASKFDSEEASSDHKNDRAEGQSRDSTEGSAPAIVDETSNNSRLAAPTLHELDNRMWKICTLLIAVLGVTSISLVVLVWSSFGPQKGQEQPVSQNLSYSVLLGELSDLRRLISALTPVVPKIETPIQALDTNDNARVMETGPAPVDIVKTPTPLFKERPVLPPAPKPCPPARPEIRNSSHDDLLSVARDLGERFREAILQNHGKFQAGWETFRRSLAPSQVDTQDVWYDLLANEKVLTAEPVNMNASVRCRVLLMWSQENGCRGLLFISHIGEFTPRSEDFPFCDVRTEGTIQRDRLVAYLPPEVVYTPSNRWEVTRKGSVEYC